MKKAWLLFHIFGISGLTTSVFLQILVFWTFLKGEIFIAYEQNLAILGFEVFMMAFAAIYLLYILYELVGSVKT